MEPGEPARVIIELVNDFRYYRHLASGVRWSATELSASAVTALEALNPAPMNPLMLKASDRVRFSPDGLTCLTVSRQVRLLEVSTPEERWRSRSLPHSQDAAFSPNSRFIALGSWENGELRELQGD